MKPPFKIKSSATGLKYIFLRRKLWVDLIVHVWTQLDPGPEAYSCIGEGKSDTQVPLLLLVKAHCNLNIHTTLSGPSVRKIDVFINLPNYLFSFLCFSPLLPWFCRTLSISR